MSAVGAVGQSTLPDSAVEAFDGGSELDLEALGDPAQLRPQGSAIDWEWKSAENKVTTISERKLDSEGKPRKQIADFDPNTNVELQDFEETEFDIPIVEKAPSENGNNLERPR